MATTIDQSCSSLKIGVALLPAVARVFEPIVLLIASTLCRCVPFVAGYGRLWAWSSRVKLRSLPISTEMEKAPNRGTLELNNERFENAEILNMNVGIVLR